MKKRILAVLLIGVMLIAMTSCSEELARLGKWRIIQVTAGDITMTESDIDDMGLDAGYIKINKSGSCKIVLLGDEYDGAWIENADGSLSFVYDVNMKGSATIDDDVMTMTDAQGSVYTLIK